MAVTHPTDVRNGIADLVVDLIDAGGAGTIVFQDGSSGDSDVATLTFSATAFGAAASGIATAAAITDDTDCNAGTVSKFTVFSGAGDEVYNEISNTIADICWVSYCHFNSPKELFTLVFLLHAQRSVYQQRF